MVAPDIVILDAVILESTGGVVSTGAETVTVVFADADLPVPEQETEYVVVVVGESEIEPLVVLLVEKFVPVQLVALVEFHERVIDCPVVIDERFEVSVTVGVVGGGVPDNTSSAPIS